MKINKEKSILMVIFLIIILLIIFFVFGKEKQKEEITSNTDNIIEQTSQIEQTNQSGEIVNDNNKTDQTNLKSFNKEEFDRIMILGSNAYNNKEYQKSINYYKEALAIEELDVVYAKMYLVYMSMKDYINASIVLEKAKSLKPDFNQYWFWTIEMKKNIDNMSYDELYKIYQDGFDKVEITAKINLVTFFASLSGQMNEKVKAIELWKKAIELNPKKESIYQAEIDYLQNK